ncbi:MAG: glycosyltransferase [Planctomycetes bacterium]|nr:glycosyltransferase [Planctomycetota bacterium]
MTRASLALPRSASVLMPTYQAAGLLDRVLASLARQATDFPWDFHALDCGSTDDTLAIFERWASRFPVALHVHALRDSAFDHGDARNRLAALSHGELLVYLTDDATPDGDAWLASLRACFADPRVGAAYCRNVPRPDARPFARIATRNDPTYAEIPRVSERPDRRTRLALGPDELRALYAYCDTASAVRRELWERHPYPITQAGEDMLLARALIDAGYVVRYETEARVLHSHEWSEERLRRRAAVDGRFHSECFGRISVRGPDDAQRLMMLALEVDLAELRKLGLPEAVIATEFAHAQAQRNAYFYGLLEGQRPSPRRFASALLDSPELSLVLLAGPTSGPGAAQLAQQLVARGHRVRVVALDARGLDADGVDVLHVLEAVELDPWLRANPAFGAVAAIVPDSDGWDLLALGASSLAWGAGASGSRTRIGRPRGAALDFEARAWESRYRTLAATAAARIVADRWGRECDVREGQVIAQGPESVLLGRAPAAIEFEVGPLPSGAWELELHLELLGIEPSLALEGSVRVDGVRVGEFGPCLSAGSDRIEVLEFALPIGASPRRVRIETGREFERRGFVRVRRVIVRRAARPSAAPTPSARLASLRVEPGPPVDDARLPRVAVVIATVDARAMLERCLAALSDSDYPAERVQVCVVDNGSRDDTVRFLARRHPKVRVLAKGTNLGFTRAVAAGVESAPDADVYVLLNNDVVVERTWLRELVSPIARGECAATGARMLLPDGTPEYLGGGASFQGFAIGCAPGERERAQAVPDSTFPRKTLFACGGAMAIDARAWRDVGGLDPEFFAYYDDLDLGWRLWLFGHEVHYVPSAVCRHTRSSTSRRFPRAAVRRLQVRNALLCAIKNYDDASLNRLLPALLALAARRTWVMARGAGTSELAIEGRPPKPAWRRWLARKRKVELDPIAFADLAAVNEVLGEWNHWMARRAEVQAGRKRDDAELFELFLDPLWCVEGEREYVELQQALVERFELAALFGAARPPRAASSAIAPTRSALPPARGCFEELASRDGELEFAGWLVVPEGSADAVELRVDGRRIAVASTAERPDVAACFRGAPGALRSGFRGRAALPDAPPSAWRRVEALALRANEPVASMPCTWRADFRELFADPPAERMLRVAAAAAPVAFRLDGLRTLTEFVDALRPHRAPSSIASVLDWGAGCGRVSGFLRTIQPTWRVTGCDVDADAVAWAREQHRGASFDVSPFEPPLAYEAGAFDLVVAYSVFTHLERAHQLAWLAELARVLEQGGFLIATVQGPDAARLIGLGPVLDALAKHGMCDDPVDPALDGVVPTGRYRATFQTEAWTRAHWSREFDVVEYLPRGAQGLQDLVVLRKRRPRRSKEQHAVGE